MISVAFALALITSNGPVALGASEVAAETDPVRILIVGDSVTQGSSGDWTWRYRLWRHLAASGIRADFVGPRDDLFDVATGDFGSHEYVDVEFDRDHAARWGMLLAAQDHPIGELVRAYRPDVVVEMLGVNDLVGLGSSPTRVHDQLTTLVDETRKVDSGIDIVLGELPQTWFPPVVAFNEGLPALAQSLTGDTSRVIAAPTGQGFTEYVDTYDTKHPSATGEMKIAAGFADALALLDIGSAYPRPLPELPNGPRHSAQLTVHPGDRSASLSWVAPPGATGQYIWLRDTTIGQEWVRLLAPVGETSWTIPDLTNFHTYEVRLQAAKGTAISEDLFSNTVEVTPNPPAVSGMQVLPRRHGLRVTWRPVDSVPGYRVTWWSAGYGRRVAALDTWQTSTTLRGLTAGRTYQVRVSTLTDGQPGPGVSASAVPSGPRVKGPSSLRVVRRSGRTLRLDWRARKQATRYQVWGKKGKGRWRSLGWTRQASFDRPQSALHVLQLFRVRSWHQRIPGGWSPTRRFHP